MSDNMPVLTSGLLPSKLDRRISRAGRQIDTRTAVALRRDAARLERISRTTQNGMLAVSHMATVEATLVNATPHAADRIHAVAVAGAMGVVGVVHDAGRGF